MNKKMPKGISAGALIFAVLLSASNIGITAAGDKDIGVDCFYGMRGLKPEVEEPVIETFPLYEKNIGASEVNAYIELYSDAEKTVPFKGEPSADSYVYYTVKAKDGYVCRRFVITADYVDDEKFMLGSNTFAAYAETYLMGDVTSDNTVNAEDLVRLMKCLANKHDNQFLFEIKWPCADTNMDNKVNSKDLVRTMQIISGQKVESPACKSAAAAVESSETRYDALQTEEAKWDFGDIDDKNTKLTVINSVEELRAWDEKFAAEHPYDESEKPDGNMYSGININYENYTEEYFAEHTLAIVSTPVTNNAFDAPAYIDSELRGDTLTVIMEKRYGRGAIEGGDPAIANSFIELPRTDAGKIALEVRPDYYELLCESD